MELLVEAGFPDGTVNVVTGFGQEVGSPLIDHPDVAKLRLQGQMQRVRKYISKQLQNWYP